MKKGGNKSRGKDAVKKPRVNSDPDTFCVRDGDLFTVDGGVLEGGGQILRNCVALSGLLGHSLRIKNIRANRPRGGGLKAQHLEGISLVAQLYDAKLDGAQLGSVAVEFRPQQFRSDVTAATADTKTAGSICLLIQTALPCCVFSPNGMTLTLRGGTNATQAPPIDYFMHVLLPLLQTMGINCNSRITRRGFFPKGGGEVVLRIDALAADSCIAPIRLMDRGIVQRVEVHVHFTPDQKEDDERWAQRKAQLEKFLKEKLRQCEQIEWIEEEARGSRDSACGATVVAVTSTGCRIAHSELLEKADSKKNSANVAERAVKGLIEHELDVENWNCVDRYMQDQLIVFAALANGTSQYRCGPLTLHTRTAIFFANKLTGAKFRVLRCDNTADGNPQEVNVATDAADYEKDHPKSRFIIECEGVGLKRQ